MAQAQRVLLVALAVVLSPIAADAARKPVQIRIEGYVEAAPKGVHTVRTIGVQIGKGATRKLAVTELRNLGEGTLGANILDHAARYKPSFRLVADQATLKPLEEAASGTFVKITGNLSSSRYVLVSQVDAGK